MRIYRPFLVSALAAALAACASTPAPSHPGLNEIDSRVDGARADLEQRAGSRAASFERLDEMWLGATRVERAGPADPPVFNDQVKFHRLWPATLPEVAQYISSNYGLQVQVSDDAIAAASDASRSTESGAPSLSAAAGPVLPPVGGNLPPGGTPIGAVAFNPGQAKGLNIDYSGNLRGFLDHVTALSGTSWRYRSGRVEIFALETRVFQLELSPGSVSFDASITNRSQGGGSRGGGGGAQGTETEMGGGANSNVAVELDPFAGVVEAIDGLLTERGTATATPAMAQVVVTDRPAALERISAYVEQVNAIASRQVALDVRVYLVEAKRSNGHAISWDMVWKSVSSSIGVDLSAGNTLPGSSTLGMSVLDAGSPFNGSRVLLDALATQGNVRELTSATPVTLSGRPVSMQVAEETGYLESSQVSLVPDVGQQVSLTPGKVTSGFSMNLLPIMSGSDTVLMQAMINLSSLRELRRLGSDSQGNMMETPLIDSRQIMQNVRLKSGQTLVLTGFEQETLRSDAAGVGHPKFSLLGGKSNSDKRATSLVILITPRVIS